MTGRVRISLTARATLGTLLGLAALAPWIANEVPLLVIDDGGLEFPVLRTFGALEAFWTGAGVAALLAWIVRTPLRRRRVSCTGVFLVLLLPVLVWTLLARPANLAVVDFEARAAAGATLVQPPIPHAWRDVDQQPGSRLLPPGARPDHLLGTDDHGRDVCARLLFGAQVSLTVGVLAVAISTLIGVFVGGLAGYRRGWTDGLLSWVVQVFMCFPVLFTVLVLQSFLSPSLAWIILLLGLTRWTASARLTRGEVLRLREETFVEAARVQGQSAWQVIRHHLLPHALGPVLVNAAFGVGGAILLESALSFLGLGVPEPMPSWGGLLAEGRAVLPRAPWLVVLPGGLILLTVLAWSRLAEDLRRALDPTSSVRTRELEEGLLPAGVAARREGQA